MKIGFIILMLLVLSACQSSAPVYGPVYHPAGDKVTHTEDSQAPLKSSPNETVVPIRANAAIDSVARETYRLMEQQRWQDVLVSAERGLRIDRRHAEFYWMLGRAYQAMEEFERARAFAHQGLRYASKDDAVYLRLQQLLQY